MNEVDDPRHDRYRDFVRNNSRVTGVPLVPEIAIYSATELSPLWHSTQSELDTADVGPPFWAFPWAGGQALARFVIDHPEWITGRRVFDFASGSGLCAIAAKLAGASSVWAVDTDPLAVAAIRLNAQHAGVEIVVSARDWVDDALGESDPEVILAGDTFYEREPAARFEVWLRSLAAAGRTVLVGDPGRAYLPAGFEQLASYEVPVAFELESQATKTCVVYQVLARQTGPENQRDMR